ncbi:MAG: hypothetical protein J7513_12720 [Solirubrobacteraceae bacterium]|nr:hypothetical protein [Solirubrobacteraceae bacterium]
MPAAAAAAPTPFQAIEPLSVFPDTEAPACGAIDDLAGPFIKAAGNDLEYGQYAAVFALLLPRPVVAVCDPARRAAGLPGLGISGTLLDARPLADSVGFGYRQLSAPVLNDESDDVDIAPLRGGGLAAGDALTIPAADSASVLDVAVLAGNGTRTVRFEGWGDGTSTSRLSVAADATGRTAILERADGVRVERRVELVAEPTPTITATKRGRRVDVRVAGLPAGIAWAELGDHEATPSGDRVADSALFRFAKVRTGRWTFELNWGDTTTRRFLIYHCSLRVGATAVKVGRCTRTTRADGAAWDARPRTLAAKALRLGGRLAMPASTRSPAQKTLPRPLATAAAATPRLRVAVKRTGVRWSAAPIGDLNGDGRAEFSDGTLWLSGPSTSTRASRSVIAPIHLPGDLDGDGRSELLLADGFLAYSAGPWVAGGVPPAKVGARVAQLRMGGVQDSPSGAGPDAVGPLDDITGDGRPELALVRGGAALVIASQAATAGASHAVPEVAFAATDFDDAEPDGETSASPVVDSDPPPLAVGGGLYRLRFDRRATRLSDRSLVAVERRNARGVIEWETPAFTVPGSPRLADRDPSSGDLLVLSTAAGCISDTIVPGQCFTWAYRLRPDGTVRSATKLDEDDGTREPLFGPDGPDADTLPELFLPTTPVSIMPSVATGIIGGGHLPVLVTGKAARPLNASWSTDHWSRGQTLRAVPMQVHAKGALDGPWRHVSFAGD